MEKVLVFTGADEKMKEVFGNLSFYVGVGLTALIIILVATFADTKVSRYDNAIEACQRDLPRNQKCTFTAVPESVIKNAVIQHKAQ